MNRSVEKKLFAIFAAISLAVVFVFAISLFHIRRNAPPLPSDSRDYWNAFSFLTRGVNFRYWMPDGIPDHENFGEWFMSITNEHVRARAAEAVIETDRENAVVFLEWLVKYHPEWRKTRSGAFLAISSTTPYWDEQRPKKWTQKEIDAFSTFFRRHLETERSWPCRSHMDHFFLYTDPDWKASKDRLVFLEACLGLPGSNSNAILRLIATRTEPVDVERYERHMKMIRH